MAWTLPKTWSSGAAVTASELNEQVRDNLEHVNDRLTLHGITSTSTVQYVKTAGYGVSAALSDASANDSTDTKVQFSESDEEWKDVSSMHSDAYPARFIAPVTGRYACEAWATFEANASNRRELWIEKDQTTAYNRVRHDNAGSGAVTGLYTACEIYMTAGSYVMLMVRQNSGSTLDVSARFQMRLTAQ